MRLFTFDVASNPGRSASWSVQAEAVRLADAGTNGLAGIILRDGYSPIPTSAVLYVRNEDKATMASLCAEIIAGLSTRTSEAGTVAPVINGTPLDLFRRRLADLAERKASGIVVDGRRRCIASIIAYGCGREDLDMIGIELTTEQATMQEVAYRTNVERDLAARLDPWSKVEAGERVLADKPTTNETEMMSVLGAKRGDGQLIHRSASAIRKHGLTPNRKGRCPSKEEWKAILDEMTSEGAKALLARYQTDTRAKALGVDQVAKALSVLPEGTILDARALSVAMSSREALDAFLAGK